MIWLSMLAFLVALGFGLMKRIHAHDKPTEPSLDSVQGYDLNAPLSKYKTSLERRGGVQGAMAVGYSVFGGIGVLFLLIASLTIVQAGYVGVAVIFGSVQPQYIPEGIHLINPFASVEKMNVRTQTYTMVSQNREGQKEGDDSIFAQSRDGIVLNVDLTVAYKLLEPMAPWVYRHFGPEYAEAIVRPAARSAVPDATGLYAYQDAYGTHRQELNDKIAQRIQVRLKEICDQYKLPGQAIVIQQVMMRKMEPPASLRASIEAKAAQEQASLQMEYTLQKERQEAERKRIEAKGIADFQAIVTQGISDKLLEWKGIEARENLAKSNNTKMVIIGAGKNGLPVILGQ